VVIRCYGLHASHDIVAVGSLHTGAFEHKRGLEKHISVEHLVPLKKRLILTLMSYALVSQPEDA
jgi:hypothetical protein